VVVIGFRLGEEGEEGMLGEEEEDFREDFKGFPFERRMGVEEERETVEQRGRRVGVWIDGERERGEERGKGTMPSCTRERFSLKELFGFNLRVGMYLSSSSSASESGVVALEEEEEESWSSFRKWKT
jgi:hypothetical protein